MKKKDTVKWKKKFVPLKVYNKALTALKRMSEGYDIGQDAAPGSAIDLSRQVLNKPRYFRKEI